MQRLMNIARVVSTISKKVYSGTSSQFSTLHRPVSNNILAGNSLLIPQIPILQQTCGMKVKGRLRRRCKSCYFVVRDERLYVMCKEFGRHKQMAMKPKPHNTYILTHASQSRVRPW